MKELSGKLVVVTGAAGGIGRACVEVLLQAGARLLLIDRNDAGLRLLAQESAENSEIRTVCSALGSPPACSEALASADGPVFALVHLAGVFEEDGLDPEYRLVWDRAIASNLTSAFDMACACAPLFARDEASRIVFMTSIAYRRGSLDHMAYSASKGGVAALVRAMSRRLAPRVLVNGIAPGIIDTPMPQEIIANRGERLKEEIPLRRWGRASEVAGVVRFLCGPDATYITGQIIT